MKILNNRFSEKRAFITGAGSGLGAAFSNLLIDNDWRLYLTDINEDSLKPYEDKPNIKTYVLDVSDKKAYETLAYEIKQETQGLDLVINNAGIGDGELFENYGLESWEKMIEVNLMGTYYGCHFMLPFLQRSKGGLIVNIGSSAGFMNAPGMSAYNTSKAAVYALSETLFHELESQGIHVTVATPTFFQTNIMQHAEGSRRFVDFAQKQMKYSKTNADEMAEVILTQASQGAFQVLFPNDARKNYRLKKWFPGLVRKEFKRMLKKFTQE